MPNDMREPIDIGDAEVVREVTDLSTVGHLNKAEIDQQIATAHRYPRSVKGFRDEALTLCTLDEDVAAECTYSLPRADKTVVGPSARFAEVLAHSWGNCRAGARVVDDKGTFIVAQGRFLDLQKNVGIEYEVQRRITDKKGRRFSDDMITVTANAACSIALRNAVLKGVPKALWSGIWEKSKQVAIGDASTFASRRDTVMQKLSKMMVTEAMVLEKLGRASVDDITVDDLAILIGAGTALKEGDATVDQLFGKQQAEGGQDEQKTTGAGQALKDKLEASQANKKQPPPANDKVLSYAEVEDAINKCVDADALNVIVEREIPKQPEKFRKDLSKVAMAKLLELQKGA